MITRWDIHEKLGDARPLNRDATKMSAAVSETNIICTMSIQPFEIFVRARCVHDEEKFFVADAIRNQVVDDSAAFLQQKSVLALANLQLVDVVGQHRIQPTARIAVIDDQLAHVRNVEHADVLSDGLMFFHNAGVLNRHQPSGERHHLRAASYVLVVKRRLFLRGFGQAANYTWKHVAQAECKTTRPLARFPLLTFILSWTEEERKDFARSHFSLKSKFTCCPPPRGRDRAER